MQNLYREPFVFECALKNRKYFSFYNYEYSLDVSKQAELLSEPKDLFEGLKESYEWFKNNPNEVIKKDYIDYIQQNF